MAEVEIKVRLPVLNPGDAGEAVARVQHILNDLDRWTGVETLLNENGDFGRETKDRGSSGSKRTAASPARPAVWANGPGGRCSSSG